MGRGYDAICKECRTKFQVNEGSGMIAMPFFTGERKEMKGEA